MLALCLFVVEDVTCSIFFFSGLYVLSLFADYYFRMGESEAVAADATVGVDAAATTATYFVPDASSSGDKSSFGSESAMQGSSNEQEASISVDHQANHGMSVSESMSVTTENGSISAEAQINSSGNSAATVQLYMRYHTNDSFLFNVIIGLRKLIKSYHSH